MPQAPNTSEAQQPASSVEPVYVPVYIPVYLPGDDGSSTNETIDNQPGAGRTLDLAYQFFGRKLEKVIGAAADRFGYGPVATGKRIKILLASWYIQTELSALPRDSVSKKDRNKLRKAMIAACKNSR